MEMKFYRCRTCGQIITIVKNTEMPIVCCGMEMEELVAGVTDGAKEKHVPVCKQKGNIVEVSVGMTEHPMTKEHYIEWIAIQTKFGNQRKILKPDMKPKVCFALCECDEVKAIYAYCNIHSLWKSDCKNIEKEDCEEKYLTEEECENYERNCQNDDNCDKKSRKEIKKEIKRCKKERKNRLKRGLCEDADYDEFDEEW